MCRVPLLLQLTDIVTGQSGALLVLKQGTTLLVSDGEVVDAGTALASIPSWGWGTSFDRPYGGLETFRQLLSAAVPDHPAPIAPISGEIRWDGESPFVDIVPEDGGAFMRLAIPAADWELRIMPGMFVEAGDWLTASLIDPSTLLAAIGRERFAAAETPRPPWQQPTQRSRSGRC
ncbi:MAG: hypothetical protein ACI8RZ_007775 [Myxococcota bacterium]